MKSAARYCIVVACLAIGTLVATGWIGRAPIAAWTRIHLARNLQSQIAALPEGQAAQLVQSIEEEDPQWQEVILVALSEKRPAVAFAAQSRLVDFLEAWAQAAPEKKSSHVGNLARLLAANALQLPPERVAIAQALAQKLLAWPIDGRQVDAARLFADCQAILELPVPETLDDRIAAVPPSTPAGAPMPPPALPIEVPATPESAPLAEAAAQSPLEPRRLPKTQATRISDK